MLRALINEYSPEYLTTYTRNPAVIKMIQRESSALYPLVDEEELRSMAAAMAHATYTDAVYHEDRYGKEGLFIGEDPASKSLVPGKATLIQQFPGLVSSRNALILAARVRKDKK